MPTSSPTATCWPNAALCWPASSGSRPDWRCRRGTGPGGSAGTPAVAERHAKTTRIQAFRARLAEVGQQLDTGRVSMCRGGKALLRKRNNLTDAAGGDVTGPGTAGS